MSVAQRIGRLEKAFKPQLKYKGRTYDQLEDWEKVYFEVAGSVLRYRRIGSGLYYKIYQELGYDRNGRVNLFNKDERMAIINNARAQKHSFCESGKNIAEKISLYPEIEKYFDIDLLQQETGKMLAEHYLDKLRELDELLYKEGANDY